MGIEYNLNDERKTDLVNDCSESNKADFGGELAHNAGVDLNYELPKIGKIKEFVAGSLAVIAGSTALAFNRDNSNYTDIPPAQAWQQDISMNDIGTDLENDMTRVREAEEQNSALSEPVSGVYDD